MDNFLRRLTPGQLRFISSVCRAILGFHDNRPKTFRFIVNAVFWTSLVALSVSITLDLAGYVQAIADNPVGALFWALYLLFWPWLALLKLLLLIFHLLT